MQTICDPPTGPVRPCFSAHIHVHVSNARIEIVDADNVRVYVTGSGNDITVRGPRTRVVFTDCRDNRVVLEDDSPDHDLPRVCGREMHFPSRLVSWYNAPESNTVCYSRRLRVRVPFEYGKF